MLFRVIPEMQNAPKPKSHQKTQNVAFSPLYEKKQTPPPLPYHPLEVPETTPWKKMNFMYEYAVMHDT